MIPAGTAPAWPWEIDSNYRPTIRASALNKATVCPGSPFLAQSLHMLETPTETEYTSVGQEGHRWMERRLMQGQLAADRLYNPAVDPELLPALHELWEWLEETKLFLALEPDPVVSGAIVEAETAISFKVDDVEVTGHLDVGQRLGKLGMVADYKFLNDPSDLPKLSRDLQQYSYAHGWQLRHPEIQQIQIHRILSYYLRADSLTLDQQMMAMVKQAIEAEVRSIWARRDQLQLSSCCNTCLVRHWCRAWLSQDKLVPRAAELFDGTFKDETQVLRFLIALPAAEQWLEQAKARAREFIAASKRPLVDITGGQQYSAATIQKDQIVDPLGAIAVLSTIVGKPAAIKAAGATKASLEKVLKSHGIKKDGVEAFFADLRSRKMITKKDEVRWEWRPLKKN